MTTSDEEAFNSLLQSLEAKSPLAKIINSIEAKKAAKGAKGDKGDIGLKGAKGEPGKDGKDGRDGKDGKNGKDGKDGVKGDKGDKGEPGKDGKEHYLLGSTSKFHLKSVGSGSSLISHAKPRAAELKSLVAGTGITLTPAADSITITGSAVVTDEQIQDAVGNIFTDSSTIDFTYNDALNQITGIVIDDSITNTKLANMATSRVIGRITAGTGDPEYLTGGNLATIIGLQDAAFIGVPVDIANGGTSGITAEEAQINLITPLDIITTADSVTKLAYFSINDESGGKAYKIQTLDFTNYVASLVPAATPGGSNGDIQVNVAGVFSNVAGLTWSTVTQHLTVVSQGTGIVPIVAKDNNAGFTANYYEARTVGNTLQYAVRAGGGIFYVSRAALSAEGDTWNDSTQKTHATFLNGVRQDFVGALFTQTADQTVTNTTTETTILGTGVGTKTLPANFFVAGKTIRIKLAGVYSTPIGAPSVIAKIKYGSTTLATITTTALGSGAASLRFEGEALITCRTTGSSGTVMTDGCIEYETVAGTIKKEALNNGGATTTINTTTSNAIDVTVQWDTNTTSRIAKSTIFTLEVLK